MSVSDPPAVPWEPVASISPSRLTRMGHCALPGSAAGVNTAISNLNPIYKTMLVTCTADGAGFFKDQTYKRNSDNTAWITVSGGAHLHDSTAESAGGLLSDILRANQLSAFDLRDTINPNTGSFMSEGSGAPAATDEPANSTGGRIVIATGATTGNWRHLSRGGVKLSFAAPSQFVFKGNVDYSGNGNLTCYIGAGLASVNDAHNNLQYGIQVCDSSTTERQWEMVNGNGSSKGVQSTADNVKSSTVKVYKILYTPGLNTKLWVGNSLQGTNANAMVASGSGSGIRNVSFGLKTNTTATRTLYCYGVSLVGTISDSAWL